LAADAARSSVSPFEVLLSLGASLMADRGQAQAHGENADVSLSESLGAGLDRAMGYGPVVGLELSEVLAALHTLTQGQGAAAELSIGQTLAALSTHGKAHPLDALIQAGAGLIAREAHALSAGNITTLLLNASLSVSGTHILTWAYPVDVSTGTATVLEALAGWSSVFGQGAQLSIGRSLASDVARASGAAHLVDLSLAMDAIAAASAAAAAGSVVDLQTSSSLIALIAQALGIGNPVEIVTGVETLIDALSTALFASGYGVELVRGVGPIALAGDAQAHGASVQLVCDSVALADLTAVLAQANAGDLSIGFSAQVDAVWANAYGIPAGLAYGSQFVALAAIATAYGIFVFGFEPRGPGTRFIHYAAQRRNQAASERVEHAAQARGNIEAEG
jgi:hypothetical protein